jgi:hypothetical protein
MRGAFQPPNPFHGSDTAKNPPLACIRLHIRRSSRWTGRGGESQYIRISNWALRLVAHSTWIESHHLDSGKRGQQHLCNPEVNENRTHYPASDGELRAAPTSGPSENLWFFVRRSVIVGITTIVPVIFRCSKRTRRDHRRSENWIRVQYCTSLKRWSRLCSISRSTTLPRFHLFPRHWLRRSQNGGFR